MDIYAKEGHRITVTDETINYGYNHHKETANKYLKAGNIYTVDHTDVDGWHTDVYIKEVPGVAFNSIHFEDVA